MIGDRTYRMRARDTHELKEYLEKMLLAHFSTEILKVKIKTFGNENIYTGVWESYVIGINPVYIGTNDFYITNSET